MSLLEQVKTSRDIKGLSVDELAALAGEIRERIIGVVKNNGGHLSSNLEAVDLIVALYYVFDFPTDKLIFDVGHQSYAHKILSGRNDLFDTIRQYGGISGFPNMAESVYDAFGAGHAGSSLSASLGYCAARDALGEDYTVIDLVGDASFFNGEYLEAVSSETVKPRKLIIILNDNGMSISRNNNALYKFFSGITTKKSYGKFMYFAEKTLGKTFLGRALKRFKSFIKFNINKTTIVESLGLKYVGIFDGNNVKELVRILQNLKFADRAVLLHLKTVKGKGMPEAESKADTYHGIGKNLVTNGNTFAASAGRALCKAAEQNSRITAICAGMKDGTGLNAFAEKYPERFFDAGIAEEHAVTFAAGQAAGGLRPFVCIYSTFLQRAYDQIMQDVCIQGLPVVFLVDRAGAVGSDGVTHQGLFDISYLRSIPGLYIFAPKDSAELEETINHCLSLKKPCAVRYPNGLFADFDTHTGYGESLWEKYGEGDNVILAVGPRALATAFEAQKTAGNGVTVVNARSIRPMDEKLLDEIKYKNIITVEENVVTGGFGSGVTEYYAGKGIRASVKIFAFPDGYVDHAPQDVQLKLAGITAEEIGKALKTT